MKWFSPYSPLGLDIGSGQVKVVQLRRVAQQWAVHDVAVASVPPIEAPQTHEGRARIARCLATLLEMGAFKGKQTVSVLPCTEADIRTVRVAHQEDTQDIRDVVRHEAESYLPYAVDEAVLDSIVIGEEGEDRHKQQRCLLVSARRANVDNHLALLQEAGLECRALDVQPLALSRLLLDHQHHAAAAPLLVVDIGCHYSIAFVLWRGAMMYHRSVAWGGFVLTQAIMKDLDMNWERAEQLKQQYGIEPQTIALNTLTAGGHRVNVQAMPGLIYEIVRPQLESFAQELERILSYWGVQFHGAVIQRVLLSGGSAALRNLAGYLQQRMAIDVAVVDPWQHFQPAPRTRHRPNGQHAATPALATAFGLALRGSTTHG